VHRKHPHHGNNTTDQQAIPKFGTFDEFTGIKNFNSQSYLAISTNKALWMPHFIGPSSVCKYCNLPRKDFDWAILTIKP